MLKAVTTAARPKTEELLAHNRAVTETRPEHAAAESAARQPATRRGRTGIVIYVDKETHHALR